MILKYSKNTAKRIFICVLQCCGIVLFVNYFFSNNISSFGSSDDIYTLWQIHIYMIFVARDLHIGYFSAIDIVYCNMIIETVFDEQSIIVHIYVVRIVRNIVRACTDTYFSAIFLSTILPLELKRTVTEPTPSLLFSDLIINLPFFTVALKSVGAEFSTSVFT